MCVATAKDLAADTALQQEEHIIVFVHGIIGLRPHLSLRNIFRLIADKVSGTGYEKTLKIMRDDPFFYQNQAMQEPGLVPIDLDSPLENGQAAKIFAHLFDKQWEQRKGANVKRRYYTFGWSGLVNVSAACTAADDLYQALYELISKQQTPAKIFILGYSRGGTIGMNLAKIDAHRAENEKIAIEELITIGTPITKNALQLIQSSIFKRAYHFYSRRDKIQPLDIFSPSPRFTLRRIHPCAYCGFPEKFKQFNIKLSTVYKGRSIDHSPDHTELWTFGWPGSLKQRDEYPLYPLPTAIFIPLMIEAAEKELPQAHEIMLNIRSNCGEIRLHERYGSARYSAPFINACELHEWQDFAMEHKPLRFNKKIYNEHVNMALRTAQPCKMPRKKKFKKGLGV